jgi:hypothetical protein
VVGHDDWYGYETRNDETVESFTELQSTDPANTVHVRVLDRMSTVITPVVTGPWGGMALDPWL